MCLFSAPEGVPKEELEACPATQQPSITGTYTCLRYQRLALTRGSVQGLCGLVYHALLKIYPLRGQSEVGLILEARMVLISALPAISSWEGLPKIILDRKAPRWAATIVAAAT